MSAISQVEFKCQKCGKDITTLIKNSANFMSDEEEMEEVINGEVMTYTCETCGRKHFLDRPFLFSDIPTGRFIWYIPTDIIDVSEFCKQNIETVIFREYEEFAKEVAKLKV